jgi:flagellar biosynthesis protein FliQ
MMLISFYLGQKHFPIPYELKRIGLYAALALAIYLIHAFVPVKNQTLSLIRATILLVIYGFAVIYTENMASRIWAYVVKLKSKLKK